MLQAPREEAKVDVPQEIARAIARSARVVLAQHGIPDEEDQLSFTLGNNCAQHVILLIETLLEPTSWKI